MVLLRNVYCMCVVCGVHPVGDTEHLPFSSSSARCLRRTFKLFYAARTAQMESRAIGLKSRPYSSIDRDKDEQLSRSLAGNRHSLAVVCTDIPTLSFRMNSLILIILFQ